MKVVRSVASVDKFYRLPPYKENTESNLRPSTCKGNALSISPRNQNVCQLLLYLTFLCPRDKWFKMAQKMQTYNEMSTTKGHSWVPQESQLNTQESQDYVLCFPIIERNKPKSKLNCPCLTFRLTTHQYGTWCEIWCSP